MTQSSDQGAPVAETCRGCGTPWVTLTSPAGDLCDDCVRRICRAIGTDREAVAFVWSDTLRQARGEPSDAPSVHLDLALAYSQMGLVEDAVLQAALAVRISAERWVINYAWPHIVDPRACPSVERVYQLARVLAAQG